MRDYPRDAAKKQKGALNSAPSKTLTDLSQIF
jgi:hypothetical protein